MFYTWSVQGGACSCVNIHIIVLTWSVQGGAGSCVNIHIIV